MGSHDVTATDLRAIGRREARIAAVRMPVEALEAAAAAAAEYVRAHGVEVRREWLTGAWAAC